MNMINVLQIGVGSMGKRRIRNMHHIGVYNIQCYDLRLDRMKEAENLYDVSPVKYSAVDWSRITHVIISTPPDQHTTYAIEALHHGKHVFIEASVLDEGFAELKAIHERKRDLILAPSCTMRFDPILIKAKQIIESGELGKVLLANHYFGQNLRYWHPHEDISDFYVSKKETGGAREIVPFDMVYLTWFFGKVTNIAGFQRNSETLGVNIDDIYTLLCYTDTGIPFQVTIDVVSKKSYRETKIVFENGNLEIDNIQGEIKVFNAISNSWQFFSRNMLQPSLATEQMYINELDCFLNATMGKNTFPYTIDEDHAILRILYAAEKSCATSMVIEL